MLQQLRCTKVVDKLAGSNRSCCPTLLPNCSAAPTNLHFRGFEPGSSRTQPAAAAAAACQRRQQQGCIGSNEAIQDRQNMFGTMLMCNLNSSPDWSTLLLQATDVVHSRWRAEIPGCLRACRPCWSLVRKRLGSYATAGLEVTSGTGCNRAPTDLRAVRLADGADDVRRCAERPLTRRTPLTQNAGVEQTWR